jgi:hypothetical protein
MIRDLELAFVKINILYHAAKEEVFGIGLTEELARHGGSRPCRKYLCVGELYHIVKDSRHHSHKAYHELYHLYLCFI